MKRDLDKAKRFAYNFCQNREKWDSIQGNFLENCLIYNTSIDLDNQISIFVKKIKDIYYNFVEVEDYTEDELLNILQIIISKGKMLNFDTVRKTKTMIESGIYDDELKIIKTKLELEELDWGSEEWII